MKKLLVLLSFGALLFASCSDFLDQYPSNNVTDGNYYVSADDYEYAVRGIYQNGFGNLSFIWTEMLYRSDEFYVENMTAGSQERYGIDHFQEQVNYSLFENFWANCYSNIYRCNDLLAHAETAGFSIDNSLLAEAKFFRAWDYFNLYRVFGVVPLSKTVTSPDEAKTLKRCTDDEMLGLLVDDLAFAYENLPAKRPSEAGRVTKMCAGALLGKVYLQFGEYAKAESALAPLQSDSFYGLMPTAADAFDINNKLNKEYVFFRYYNASNDNGHGLWLSSSNPEQETNINKGLLSQMYADASDNRKSLVTEYIKITNTDYAMKKWYGPYDAVYTTSVSNDFPFIRYAEVVMMMAEALGQQNKIGEALPYINKIRTRAGIAALTSADVPNKDSFIKTLCDEYEREFYFEGHRWFDLVRLGQAIDAFASVGQTIDSHNFIFPIPSDQIRLIGNTDVLWQNPGY